MAKTIKFNLICDGKPIRTIEDLQNNFSIEDVLAYYNNKLLHRWLSVRGYDSELKAVSSITSSDQMEIIKELIRIFEVVTDAAKVEEGVYMLRYLDERKELCAIYEQENYKQKNIIDDYAVGYRQLVDGILENPDDVALIKANIEEIVNNYAWVLELNHRALFNTLQANNCILAIMCLLMNDTCRKYYLPIEETAENGSVKLDIDHNADKKVMYDKIREMVSPINISKLKTILNKDGCPKHLESYGGNTQQYPHFITGKKYMVVYMDSGDRIAPFGNYDFIESEKTVGKFPIYDGIQYMSNSENHTMYYMVV